MKHLMIVAALAACGNKSPSSSSDCSAAIESAVNIGMKAQIEGQHLGTATVDAMKATSVKHCTDDKWSVDAVSCLGAATTNEQINRCLEKIPNEPRMTWQQDMAALLSKGKAGSGSAIAGSAGSAGSAAPTPSAPTGIPEECQQYTKLMDRLATCEAFPKEQREAYQTAYKQVAAAFANIPPESRAQLAQGCKSTVEVITQSAAATCGWTP